MNLSHFLNKPFEEEVIQKLEKAHNDSIKYYLTLWYGDGKIKLKDLKAFLLKYESRLYFKTNIKVGNDLKFNDFIWFDILPNEVYNNNSIQYSRFRWNYSDPKTGILQGLDEFIKTYEFTIADNLPRKQKRNDDENSNHRK